MTARTRSASRFKFGDPDPHDPSLIRRGNEVFHVGDHFDIDRSGRVYRPHQSVALADGHSFTEAKAAEKLALPVCEFGPKQRFLEHCRFLAKTIEQFADAIWRMEGGHGLVAVQVREMQYKEECVSGEEGRDPGMLVVGLLGGLRGRARPQGVSPPPPPPPPPPPYSSKAGAGGPQVTAAGAGGGGSVTGSSPKLRNGHLAGQDHPKTQIPFDDEGYPDFRAAGVVNAEVKITLTGSHSRDQLAANKAAGLAKTPDGYTWHHHQDGTTMQLVPKQIHEQTGHTGGYAGTRNRKSR